MLQISDPLMHTVFDPKPFRATIGDGWSVGRYRKGQTVFSQGDAADAVFYIRKGKVKVTVLSPQGKEAVTAILGSDEFCGEGCLSGQTRRSATAKAMTDCSIMRIDKTAMTRALHDDMAFSNMFMAHLLARVNRIEADLVDQLFNSSEKRLARTLLLLANFGKKGAPTPIIPNISQETLAAMIGTTRSRVSFFMNKFRKLGFIDYNGSIEIHKSLLNFVLHEQPHIATDVHYDASGHLGPFSAQISWRPQIASAGRISAPGCHNPMIGHHQ